VTPPDGWQAAQAARCGCGGTDDLCGCQNEYNPARYGLQETEKCEECGLLASSLMHRACRNADCPVPAHIASLAAEPSYEAAPAEEQDLGSPPNPFKELIP
jgi:hypothetical protein